MDFKGKRVGVIGLGVEGLSTARFLHKKGAAVWILDRKKREDIEQDFLAGVEKMGAKLVTGENYLEGLTKYDVIVRSPGFKRNNEKLKAAEKQGVKITSQIKIFFDLCPGIIIGVTGTKGKGTTSTLIYEMLKKSGRDLPAGRQGVYLGGNIGNAPLDFLDELKPQSVVVLELSSFQLVDLDKSPHIAVVLMIVPEHLNYHEDMQEYVEAKRNILRHQEARDYAIINRDYIPSNESDIYTDGKVFYFTRERTNTEQGTFMQDGAIWMSMMGSQWKIIDAEKVALIGRHNLENAAAAAMAATLAGASKNDIVEVLKGFTGLPHRLELVRETGGVRYYDDSFSTTPETAIAAIEAFSEPEILILGGSSKNSDFRELGQVISKAKNIKAIIGVGEEWEKIKSKIKNQKLKVLLVEGAENMHQIVQAASKIARSGDVVLLSPGCASFGMFKDYKDRGEQFKKEVMKLA